MRWAATTSTLVEQPDGSLLIAVADVAGKGLASAMMSTSFRAAFRAMAITGLPLDELATRMNEHHWREGEEARRRYVTAIFMRLHPELGKIEVVNAGHNPGFLVLSDGPARSSRPPARHLACYPACATPARKPSLHRGRGCCSILMDSRKYSVATKSLARNDLWTNFPSAPANAPMLSSIHCGQQLMTLPTAARKVTT